MTTLNLHVLPGRCRHGFHLELQGCADCGQQAKSRALAVSANDLRAALSDVPGPLVGARFNAAAKAGVIRRIGYVSSTKQNTHGHPVAQWIGVQR
jgi:hypothetical protein